jgi:hypothetical protein
MTFLTLKEEHKLHVFGSKIRKIFAPTSDEVTEQFGISRNEEVCDLYSSAGGTSQYIDQATG